MTLINRYLSKKIKVLSVISTIAVLYIHAKFTESAQWIFVDIIQTFINNLCRFAVPTFFIISGYLFFNSINQPKETIPKIFKRTQTIFIPYLLWCTIFIVTIAFCSCFAYSNTSYFKLLEENRYLEFAKYVYIDPPAAFHLWYLRDLFVLFCLSPLLYWILKRCPILNFLIAITAYMFRSYEYEADALLYYSIGALYSIKDLNPFSSFSPRASFIFILIGLMLLYSNTLIYNLNLSWLGVLSLTIGIWKLYDLICKYIPTDKILKYSEFCFVIYCAHIPFLTILKSILYPHIVNGAFGCLFSFIISPIICAACLISLMKMVKRTVPKTYYAFTGGR